MNHFKKLLYPLLISLLFIYNTLAYGKIIYVKDEYPTIQEGINAAGHGDTVLVEEDIYYENIDLLGKEIVVASHFIMDGDTNHIDSTIIDGSDSSNVVVLHTGENSLTTIIGFTIQKGSATWGGGIRCIGSEPTISHCIIKDNRANWGAGFHSSGSTSPTITHCIFTDNTAVYDGGGIGCDSSEPIISYCLFFDNAGGEGGGGGAIALHWESCPLITKCKFIGNSAGEGGGVFCLDSDPTITYCIFAKNVAIGFSAGGGIQGRSAHPTITNCTFTNNTAMVRGGAINFKYYTHAEIKNCILWNNTPGEIYADDGDPTVTYCDVMGGWSDTGNIDADPLFADTANDDYHLTWSNFPVEDSTKSPCIDAGDPSSPLDPDSTVADMGALYFGQPPGIEEISTRPITFYQGPTIFKGPLILPENKKCKVFDITGRTVNAKQLTPGVYFIEIDGSISQKVIKLR